jgi:hypothetical protein
MRRRVPGRQLGAFSALSISRRLLQDCGYGENLAAVCLFRGRPENVKSLQYWEKKLSP